MSAPKRVKVCFVKDCFSNSDATPDKIFITVPLRPNLRRIWFEAARQPYASRSSKYCCEDHFDVTEDIENYMRYKLVGGKVLLKNNVVPHLFKHQLFTGKHIVSPFVTQNNFRCTSSVTPCVVLWSLLVVVL
ncbi:uncharacterized protein LOC115885750 [Sitophilus oryzae]|uniref:Uncharacterized protein LOC115885750 n=1 Tax=Sitophilus oryzae TaxID=7048 RepID=A0A6J2Y9S7_SITOR|nr:uncharacterized protein LOC115885750 [Sitophilus oryzae]